MKSRVTGFGLLELMIAMALGLIVVAGAVVVFVAQRQVYRTASSQALTQDADNALSAIISPAIRGAGFTGCSTIGNGIKSWVTPVTTPLTFDTSSAVRGFEATVTPAVLVDGAANDQTPGDWTPQLDASFNAAAVGGVGEGSDVLVLIGASPLTAPVGVTNFAAGAITVNDAAAAGITNKPQLVALSDCGKSSAFEMTSLANNVISFTLGPNGTPFYPVSSQVIPMQQTAFFVASGHANQSALFEGVMTIPPGGTAANAGWVIQEIVPGVTNMQVLYGTGQNGHATEYVRADQVANWATVTSIKLGFLIEGNQASTNNSTNRTAFTLYGQALTVPKDSRLRHMFFMTVNTRNGTLL